MQTSKQIVHARSSRSIAREASLPGLPDILRVTALVAAFVFISACVFGAI